MAFPQVAAVNGGHQDTDVTNHTVNLPADISSGDLLLVFFACDSFSVPDTITFPEGWTELFQTPYLDEARLTFGAWYRIADGEEGATISVTTSSVEQSAHTSYRITGYSGTPEVGTHAAGSSTTPDPPSLTPTWGAKDTLWFACEANDDDDHTTAYPTDYTDGRYDMGTTSSGVNVGTARRELNAVSEDPGTFTIYLAEQWIANTVAIQEEEVAVARRIFITHT